MPSFLLLGKILRDPLGNKRNSIPLILTAV